MILETQLPQRFRDIIDTQQQIFNAVTRVSEIDSIPDTPEIPIQDQSHWLQIPGVICVYVDMIGSTKLNAADNERTTARIYQLFTGTAVKLFSEFQSPYIDVQGDGVFALFDQSQPYRALAAAIAFKTFSIEVFVPQVSAITDVGIGTHIGMDQSTVLVRKIGLKRYRGRTDKQNEVWAGKVVNMASKLASLTSDGDLLCSDRFHSNLHDEKVLKSCGCDSDGNPGEKVDLWHAVDLSENENFDFEIAYKVGSKWCRKHGNEYCEYIVGLDE